MKAQSLFSTSDSWVPAVQRAALGLADQALKEGNLLFASTLVDKAGAIASLITGQ